MSIVSCTSARRGVWHAAPLLLAFAAACSDGPVAPAAPATLSLDRDTATAAVGEVVRLSARGASAITWSSSDARVAAVGVAGDVHALSPGLATITATSAAGRATARVRVPLQQTVGEAGDTLCALSSNIVVVIPTGALSGPTTVSVQDAFAPPPDSTLIPGTAHELAPASLAFATPAEIAVTYDSASVPPGMYWSSLHLVHLVDGAWEPVPGSGMNLDTTIVYGLVSSGGTYAAAAYPEVAQDGSDVFGVSPSGEPVNHVIGEFEQDVYAALTFSRNLELAREITRNEVQYATAKWAAGDLGDLAATKDKVQTFIDSRFHRVGLPATVVLGNP